MPKNQTPAGAGTLQTKPVNDPQVRTFRGKNEFPQSQKHLSSARYGEVDPLLAFKAEVGDVVPYNIETDLNTFTMASPVKSDVHQMKAAFKIPMDSIYPRNWDRMLPIPNKGDDVPEDTRALFDFGKLSSLFNQVFSDSASAILGYADVYSVNTFIKCTLLWELIHSSGSLPSKFNIHMDQEVFRVLTSTSGGFIPAGSYVVCDEYIDTIFAPWLKDLLFHESVKLVHDDPDERPTHTYIVVDEPDSFNSSGDGNFYISFRRALELLRTGTYMVVSDSDDYSFVAVPDIPSSFRINTTASIYNIEPIVAYQLVCSHFFVNPKIDYIYTAPMFRDLMQSLVESSAFFPYYLYNGTRFLYDVFSKKVFDIVIDTLYDGVSFVSDNAYYLFNLLSFKESLRYGDYFTGAHPEPLAVGDIDAPVTDGSVNTIAMVQKLQLTRLLNKANISGPLKADYIRDVLGGETIEAPKDVPVRLSLTASRVEGFEVNNTGDAQLDPEVQNIATTNLRLTDNQYMFEASINEPCWLISVQYFEAERIYSKTIDRFAWHHDRYDDFIPDMQFTGDQEIKSKELDSYLPESQNYAYCLRNMEYKNRYSYASGAFVRNLKSWAFVTDNKDGNPASLHIDPEYIRSSPSEFDRFYKSLTGYSLGTYFHFVVKTVNNLSPYRQMIFAPEILA